MLSLQEISDRLEIQDLLSRYASAIDRCDWDLLDMVFTPESYIDYSAFGGLVGYYPEIKTWLKEVLTPFPAFQHMVTNMEITINGDNATGRIMCLNPIVLPGDENPPRVGFNGLWYLDEYIRTDAGWRIARRSEEASYSHNFPAQ